MNSRKFLDEVGLPARLFLGISESNDDPENRGRVKVRVIGQHSVSKSETPTEGIHTSHLLWAEPIMPVGGGSITGRGEWPDAPENGSLLLIFFLDGKEYQRPFYFGSIGGNRRTAANPNIGFNDPEGLWPRKDRLGHGDAPYHKDETRKNLGETYYDVLKENIKEDNPDPISGAFSEDTFQETGPSSLPVGKYNHTTEYHPRDYESDDRKYRHGHIFEIDSTPEHERISEYIAPAGNYKEIDGSGNVKERIVGNRTKHLLGSNREDIKGDSNIVVNGTYWKKVMSDMKNEIMNDLREEIANEMIQKVGTKKTVESPDVVHEVSNTHKLDSASNKTNVNNFTICPFSGSMHSTQSKTKVCP
jgi:hypothetical protein